MNFYSLLPLTAAIISFSTGIFALRSNAGSSLNRVFSLFMFSAAIWGVSSFLIYNSPTPGDAFVLDKIETLSSLLSVTFMLHFCLTFTKSRVIKRRFLLALLYVPLPVFTCISATTGLIVTRLVPSYWGYKTITGDLYAAFIADLTIYALTSAVLCFLLFLRSTSGAEKKQALLLMAGISVMLTAGIVSEFILPELGFEIMPLTSTFTAINGALVAYAMLRYRLMALTPTLAADNILKTIADYMVVFNRDGTVAFLSDSALDALGRGREDVTGKKPEGVFGDGFLPGIFGRLEKEGTLRDVQSAIKAKGGKEIPVSLNCSAVKDASGGSLGYVIVMKDMTRINELIKSLEDRGAELERSKARLEKAMEDSERLNKLAVGRELKMIELKKRIAELEGGSGKKR